MHEGQVAGEPAGLHATQLPIYSWTARSTDGTAWKIPTGGAVIDLHILPLSATGNWAITEGYLIDGPPPIFPTPEPIGPDASCAQVQRIAEPGKGLVSFHLPVATPKG